MKAEIILSGIALVLLSLFLDVFDLVMPPSTLHMLVVVALVVFGIIILLFWRENPRDEREGYHRMFASRVSLILGSSVLILGIIQGLFAHTLDPFLIYALAAIIIGKLFGFMYIKRKN